MIINFTKSVPDELYIDSFTKNKTATWTYEGPEYVYVTVDKDFGNIQGFHDGVDDLYNRDRYVMVTVDAKVATDVACHLANTVLIPERTFFTETLPDGTTHDEIDNPCIRDYYSLHYDHENTKWDFKVITREPKTILNELANRYREYVNTHISKFSDNAELSKLANDYLKSLDDFETTGMGGVPSWKIIEPKLSSVPAVPSALVVAANVLP
jgi:hypothetical protein